MQTITVKKEPEEMQIQQPQTHTIETSSSGANHPQHHDNADGSTSLQIAQVQNLPSTHQLTLSNLNQVTNLRKKYALCYQ